MGMFCFQCQEALENTGCKKRGVCGKTEDISHYQDLLVDVMKGISVVSEYAGIETDTEIGRFLMEGLFVTITNANFDGEKVSDYIDEAFKLRDMLKERYAEKLPKILPDCVTFTAKRSEYSPAGASKSILGTENEDVRSLRELLVYGLKGMAAYAHHAYVLGKEDVSLYECMVKSLASTTKELSVDEMVGFVMNVGEKGVTTMALLDAANVEAYGSPELTKVKTGVGSNPGILISGHDLKDIAMLLEQTKDTGVDVYTHCEMLPAHYYPEFKKYNHLIGNYGGAWWNQNKDFDSFGGPILMTTNCITPVRKAYKDRIFTTGVAGFEGVKHISADEKGQKDFSELIQLAKTCQPPVELEDGEIIGGFAHNQVLSLADKVVDAVKNGAIKRFVVMAGCDGRQKERQYFTDVAQKLPEDTIILTAGCAKFRYNKLELGDIGGIPRVLDAGQCNDSYSLAVVALKLKEVFGLDDINKLPLSFDIAWYEQKAVLVLLALLHLGVKGIRLGPTLPAFLSPNVAKVLVENFDIKPTGEVQEDINAMMAGA